MLHISVGVLQPETGQHRPPSILPPIVVSAPPEVHRPRVDLLRPEKPPEERESAQAVARSADPLLRPNRHDLNPPSAIRRATTADCILYRRDIDGDQNCRLLSPIQWRPSSSASRPANLQPTRGPDSKSSDSIEFW